MVNFVIIIKICSCSNCLKYMENFDYWSILIDSGRIVQ